MDNKINSKDIFNEVIENNHENDSTEFSLIDNLEDWTIADSNWDIMKLESKLKNLI